MSEAAFAKMYKHLFPTSRYSLTQDLCSKNTKKFVGPSPTPQLCQLNTHIFSFCSLPDARAEFFATYENIDGGPLAQLYRVGKLSASCLSAFPGSVLFLQSHCPFHPNSFFPSLSYSFQPIPTSSCQAGLSDLLWYLKES